MKNVYLIQQGYHEPLAFSTLAKAKKWLNESGYKFKEKHAPYYWDNKESAIKGDGYSESRCWLMRVDIY